MSKNPQLVIWPMSKYTALLDKLGDKANIVKITTSCKATICGVEVPSKKKVKEVALPITVVELHINRHGI